MSCRNLRLASSTLTLRLTDVERAENVIQTFHWTSCYVLLATNVWRISQQIGLHQRVTHSSVKDAALLSKIVKSIINKVSQCGCNGSQHRVTVNAV